MTAPQDEQGELPGLARASVKESQAKARATRARKAAAAAITDVDPVARVLVDVPLAHLDRTFDYAVPAAMAADARPGARVKVRFAGQDVDGYLLERRAESDHPGRLSPLRRVVSAEPVLTTAVAALATDVATRYAGVRADVLRLAVPPRHATTEKEPSPPEEPLSFAGAPGWADYPAGAALLRHVADGGAPRAVWAAAPGESWPDRLAELAGTALAAGRGALLCVPDRKDVDRVDRALTAVLGAGHHVMLTADAGPAKRYRDFLAVARGSRRVVVGTRAAAFAPVRDLGLVVCWDDGDDLHAEPRAPYPHTREVLLLRAEREGAAAVLGSFARSVEAQHLLDTGWAHEVAAARETVRERVTVAVAGATEHDLERDPHALVARVPKQAHDAIRDGLATGPVLVQTPRAGYALALACERCRSPARCAACHGPLALGSPTAPPACRWCATPAVGWSCPECRAVGLRAPLLGDARTAEELGRAFPSVRVRSSAGDHVLAEVGDEPALVVATPGAEPVAAGGYAAVVLLDTWLLLGRDDLRAAEEALRRWSLAVALARPGGRALVVGDAAHPAVQALVRWDAAGFAAREAADRAAAHLPPASRVATVSGEAGAVDDALTLLDPPAGLEALGPVPLGDGEERLVLRVPRARGTDLSRALAELQRVRSARKLDAVRVQVDPVTL